VDEDSALAMNLTGVDVIVGAHSHTRLKHPKRINGVIIVQAGSNAENLGILDLTVENDKVTTSDGSLLQLWYNSARPKTTLSALADSMQAIVDAEYKEVIGTLKVEWKRSGANSGIGLFIADAQREGAKADVGFMNLHGIRKDLSAGPMTKRDLFEVLPFRNVLCTFTLTGKDIRRLVTNQVNDGAEVIVSGIDAEWRRNKRAEIEIVSLKVNGVEVDDNKSYTGAASDFLLGEAKKYLGIDAQSVVYTNKTVFQVVEQKVRAAKDIISKDEERIRELK